jgi:PAS domain S-box-containing protein
VADGIDFEALARGAGDAIVVADREGKIVFWNGAATRIFGFAEAEALRQSLDLIIPERLRERHWEGYDKVMKTGVTRYGADLLRVPAVHKDGRKLSIAFTVSLLMSAPGTPRAIAAFIRDETARWEKEQAMAKRLKELEGK